MNTSIHDLFDLSGKVAMITGGATGIGKGIALRFAEAGAAVVILDVSEKAGQETANEITQSGKSAAFLQVDVSRVSDADKAVNFTMMKYGRLDILVNGAGIFNPVFPIDMTEEIWDRHLDINLKGMMFFSKAAAKSMIAADRGGKIINMASVDGLRPTMPNIAHYDASKGGVVMLTQALGLAWAPMGILVNAIAPGVINTQGAMKMAQALIAQGAMTNEQFGNFSAQIPLRRMGEPDDIGKVALFLASGASDYMVGHTIVVDAGLVLM
jgi:2-deoxy-D-gluconate 3-dehydrogenase